MATATVIKYKVTIKGRFQDVWHTWSEINELIETSHWHAWTNATGMGISEPDGTVKGWINLLEGRGMPVE